MIQKKSPALHVLFKRAILIIPLILIAACRPVTMSPTPDEPTATLTEQPLIFFPSATLPSPTPIPTQTHTPGPSPTSTQLTDLETRTWQGQGVMIEAAYINTDTSSPFSYTPLFMLYGDGLLVTRSCQDGACSYLGAQLEEELLCRLVNAIDRTGFLDADPTAFNLPGSTSAAIRLSVQLDTQNSVQIPDLDRWATDPDWYGTTIGCVGCYSPPLIDPAFLSLYGLLTSYTDEEMTGFNTERLAVWLSKPVVAGTAQPWPSDLPPLADLSQATACPDAPDRVSAVILDGPTARTVSSLISTQGQGVPIFTENNTTWQIQSRWLLPYEMPQTCEVEAGLYPPTGDVGSTWQCLPEMGAIPSPTPTITPTATITPTPLR